MPTSIPLGAPVWSDFLTSDLTADVPFYAQLFGWTARDAGTEAYSYHTFSLPDGAGGGRDVMGLMPCPPGMEPSRVWNLHFKVADCDEATARAQKLGATVNLEPTDVSPAVRSSMLTDPQGASFGLVEAKDGKTGFQVYGELNSVAWVEYRFDGVPSEGMRFYADLLDWDVHVPPWVDQGDPKPYAALQAKEGEREFGGCHAAETWELALPPQWNVMLAVDDADRVCAKAVELGGTIAGEPMDVPGLRIAGIAAPSGTIVGIMSDRS